MPGEPNDRIKLRIFAWIMYVWTIANFVVVVLDLWNRQYLFLVLFFVSGLATAYIASKARGTGRD